MSGIDYVNLEPNNRIKANTKWQIYWHSVKRKAKELNYNLITNEYTGNGSAFDYMLLNTDTTLSKKWAKSEPTLNQHWTNTEPLVVIR